MVASMMPLLCSHCLAVSLGASHQKNFQLFSSCRYIILQIGYNINTGQGKRSRPSWLGGQKMKKQAWNTRITAIDGYTAYEVWYEMFDAKAFEKSGDLFWFQTDTRDWKLGAPVIDRFYNVNTRHTIGSDWFVSEEEAIKAKELHVKRLMARRESYKSATFRSSKAKELAAKIVSKKQGYKRVRAQHVNSISISKNRVSGRRQIVIDLNKKVSKNASIKVIVNK